MAGKWIGQYFVCDFLAIVIKPSPAPPLNEKSSLHKVSMYNFLSSSGERLFRLFVVIDFRCEG